MLRFNSNYLCIFAVSLLGACVPVGETTQTGSAQTQAVLTASSSVPVSKPNPFGKMVMHKDANCGCCGAYADYLRTNGAEVEVVIEPDMNQVRDKFGTTQGASCHTVEVGGYVVEGHVPVAAIEKLLREKPDIKGIALPGMPLNSPGMGEEVKGSLKVMAIEHDGSVNNVFSVE